VRQSGLDKTRQFLTASELAGGCRGCSFDSKSKETIGDRLFEPGAGADGMREWGRSLGYTTDAYTNTNTDAYTNAYTNTYTNTDTHSHTDE